MRKRLIIVTNSANPSEALTAQKRDLITGLLQGKGWHVWHWFEDLWLVIADVNGLGDLTAIRNEIQGLVGRIDIFITTCPDGEGISLTSNRAATPWLTTHWGIPDPETTKIAIDSTVKKK